MRLSFAILAAVFALVMTSPTQAETFVATDRASRVESPSGWSVENDLNDSAEIQLTHKQFGLYFIVLTDTQSDFVNMTIEKFAQRRLDDFTKALKNVELGERKPLTLNGMTGFATEFNAISHDVRIRYRQVCLQGKEKYYQILVWGVKSAFESNHKAVDEILSGFQQQEVPVSE